MNTRCIITIIITAAANVACACLINNKIVMAVSVAFISAVGLLCLFFWLKRPLQEMENRLNETEDENRQLEVMRKEFVANVTHELKTPLTSISGFIETLQDGAAEDPEVRTKFLDIMSIETARLKRIIQDILVLSDIENKNENVSEDSIIISDTVESLLQTLNPIAEGREITLIDETENNLCITGSEDRFRQMMMNLIENAIKYSNPGGRVWIGTEESNDSVTVFVKDEGIGIAPEHQERLFERFYRVDKSRSRKVGGTGLGLSIVKHIAALFDAELRLESKLGKGSTFYIIFKKEK